MKISLTLLFLLMLAITMASDLDNNNSNDNSQEYNLTFLPRELLIYIAQYLDPQDFANVRLTDRSFCGLVEVLPGELFFASGSDNIINGGDEVRSPKFYYLAITIGQLDELPFRNRQARAIKEILKEKMEAAFVERSIELLLMLYDGKINPRFWGYSPLDKGFLYSFSFYANDNLSKEDMENALRTKYNKCLPEAVMRRYGPGMLLTLLRRCRADKTKLGSRAINNFYETFCDLTELVRGDDRLEIAFMLLEAYCDERNIEGDLNSDFFVKDYEDAYTRNEENCDYDWFFLRSKLTWVGFEIDEMESLVFLVLSGDRLAVGRLRRWIPDDFYALCMQDNGDDRMRPLARLILLNSTTNTSLLFKKTTRESAQLLNLCQAVLIEIASQYPDRTFNTFDLDPDVKRMIKEDALNIRGQFADTTEEVRMRILAMLE